MAKAQASKAERMALKEAHHLKRLLPMRDALRLSRLAEDLKRK